MLIFQHSRPKVKSLSIIPTMTRLEIGSIRCAVDAEATRRVHALLASGGAERCGCLYCRNFAAARELMFPLPLQHALQSAGIDWRKESEAVHYGRLDDSGHHYQVWINFVGSVENGTGFDLTPESGAGPTVRIKAFNDADHYTPKPPAFDHHTVGRIEIEAALPWVLSEADPEPK